MSTLQSILKPASIVAGQNVNYTVPSGRIAKVTVSLNVWAECYTPNNVTAAGGNIPQAQSKSETFELTLRAGDVLSSTRSTGAGTTNDNNSANFQYRTGTAIVTLLINAVASIVASVSATSGRSGTNSGTALLISTGAADIGFVAEEYLE